MYQLKGFVSIKSLVNNTNGVVSPIGEASTWSLTYTKERGEYENNVNTGFRLISISSTDTVLGKIPVDQLAADHVLEVSNWVYTHLLGQQQPIDRAIFYDDVMAQFSGIVSDFNFGPFVDNGVRALPEWMSWSNLVLDPNSLKVWFSDSAFSEQFDETEIVPIAPLANLDDFFLAPNLVSIRLAARTASESMDLIQSAKGKSPETIIRTESYDYKAGGLTISTNWSVLIYGIQGDNTDAIKDALITYILANSTHTQEEWTAILPDLFKRTEFIIIPRWDKYAIPNMTIQAGIYSPITNPTETLTFVKTKVLEYPQAHIDEYLSVLYHTYKSLSLACIGGPDNRDSKKSITDFFPDYIAVGTNSLDFNRMELVTQNWVYLIEQMLITAETMGQYTTVPPNMRRIRRTVDVNGVVTTMLYIASVYQNVQFLVAAKSNYGI